MNSHSRTIETDASASDRYAEGLIRLPEVLRLYPVGRATWWAGVKSGRYPKGIKIGLRATAWRRADILALIDRRAAAAPAGSHADDGRAAYA